MGFDPFPILVLSLLVVVFALLARIDSRTAKNERMLRALIAHLGVTATGHVPPSDKVLALLGKPGGTVAAIRQYRAETGLGLKEAAEAIGSFSSSSSARDAS
ncbi:hypothetical protein [Lysobacter sp. HA35]